MVDEYSQAQWQVSPDSDSDDLTYVSNILDDVESSLCINLLRIYATGKSQGGGMVGLLACNESLSTRIAAYAPVSGAFYLETDDCVPSTVTIPCTPGRTGIPLMEFHGGSDPVVPYYGDDSRRDACLPAIPHWVESWAQRNHLSTSNTSTSITTSATLYQFGNGSSLGLVSHVYDGSSIGHVWPTTKKFAKDVGGDSTASFNATSMILEFFSTYSLELDQDNSTSTGSSGSDNNSTNSDSNFATRTRGKVTVWWLVGIYILRSLS